VRVGHSAVSLDGGKRRALWLYVYLNKGDHHELSASPFALAF
jgi:hypothetical protein